MGQEFHINMRQAEVLQHETPAQVPSELARNPAQGADAIVPNSDDNSTVAGLVAIYSDFLMLHTLAMEHFHVTADENLHAEKKKTEDDVKS